MDVFTFRNQVVNDYETFSRSFTKILAEDIKQHIDEIYKAESYCPAPLIQINPNFVSGGLVDDLVAKQTLHQECAKIFRYGKTSDSIGFPLKLHKHQEEAIALAQKQESYVLTTGTGSGKSLSYFIPIIDYVLKAKAKNPKEKHTTAIVIYPMNALCNSQLEELKKFLKDGYPENGEPVTFARFTGQESQQDREEIIRRVPDILLTNFMMLELLMTRQEETDKSVIRNSQGLNFLVLDELHTYRGRQGADVALLIRRVREALNPNVICLGTSATMASEGGSADRKQVVADFASRLFGAPVKPDNVITETLQRVTSEKTSVTQQDLKSAIEAGVPNEITYKELQNHSIAAWVELNLGLEMEDGKWIRIRRPKKLSEAATQLAADSGVTSDKCLAYLTQFLLLAYNTRDEESRPFYAFRLHQFIAGAGDLFSTLEPEGQRYLTVNGQQFQPGAREKLLFNVVFCRDCGQEYFPVWATSEDNYVKRIEPRDVRERSNDDEDTNFGFFIPDPDFKWNPEPEEDAYPDDWLDRTGERPKLKSSMKPKRPHRIGVDSLGERLDSSLTDTGLQGWYLPGSFKFCLHCRVSYDGMIRSDLTKLSSLSTEGRSSATTILALSVMRYLIEDATDLRRDAKKMLGFTDSRQDASLQAGHFNDFIQILLLRGALLAAIITSGKEGLSDDVLTAAVFKQLWPDERQGMEDFASNPQGKGHQATETHKSMREVLGYRLYFDLQRGWRITNPNLEQLDLLKIDYASLDECCSDEECWSKAHPLLAKSTPEVRQKVALRLLDTMRRNLCIKTIYLDSGNLEQMKNRSFNLLKEPWGLSEDEKLYDAAMMVPTSRPAKDFKKYRVHYLSHRSRFGRELKQTKTWGEKNPNYPDKFTEHIYDLIVGALLQSLRDYGIIEVVGEEKDIGYRINSSALRWTVSEQADAIPAKQHAAHHKVVDNPFFKDLYKGIAQALVDKNRLLHLLRAGEHTGQVESEEREERENEFRSAKLPVLFCSPTMELGVDIAQLNTVYMRNAPPTPANYAQRSGRAGRSGQPALVITYCAAKSPHDQYFFADPTRMVAGSVAPPTLDLSNEDLIRSHLYAMWLSETGRRLPDTPTDMLDLSNIQDNLPIVDEFKLVMDTEQVRARAMKRGKSILNMLEKELTPELAAWYSEGWLDRAINSAYLKFQSSYDRWRSLYLATTRQMDKSHAIQMNAAASEKERKEAKQRYDEARIQQELLLSSKPRMNSDFYTYRYLASQGFLPGYNFPRLPLLAFIPARKQNVARNSFLSRPRFLGLSEFGPQSIIYHEGSQYRVKKAILGIRDEQSVTTEAKLPVRTARICHECGYGHFGELHDSELCVACNQRLEGCLLLPSLYRIDHVSTRRATRITSDEEERQRQGYEMQTTLQYVIDNGIPQVTKVLFSSDSVELLELHYAPAATVWRINMGWRRRKAKSVYGFNIDVTTGVWCKDDQAPEDVKDEIDAEGKTVQRIVPYVEDRRNVLVILPKVELDDKGLTTLQFALKRGIENTYQLEESELMVEPLPNRDKRKAILFYESAEGGAGVLTRLATDLKALGQVAQKALEVCHWSPDSSGSWDSEKLQNSNTECEAGCYKCLLSYYNQMDHDLIDRQLTTVKDLLCQLIKAQGQRGTEGRSAQDQAEELTRMSGSSLEKEFLRFLEEQKLKMPDRAQPLLEEFRTRPDFAYSSSQTLIYIDGPHHEFDGQARLDEKITRTLEDAGFTVVRFSKTRTDWPTIVSAYPEVFGRSQE